MPPRILPLFALLACAACAMPSLELQPRYARHEISGTAGFTSSGVGGAADVEQAGLEADDAFSGRADLSFGSPHLIALAQAPRFDGSGTLDVTVSDGTNTIGVGAPVSTRIDLQQLQLGLVFDLLPGDTLELALGFGAAYLDLELEFEDELTGTTVASEERAPVPLLLGAASVWLGPVELAALVGGVQLEYEGDSISYLDADLYARWKLFGGDELLRGSLVVGYRWTDIDLEYDDDSSEIDADLTIQGPYFGLEFSL